MLQLVVKPAAGKYANQQSPLAPVSVTVLSASYLFRERCNVASLDHLLDVPVVVLDRVGQRQSVSGSRNKMDNAVRVRDDQDEAGAGKNRAAWVAAMTSGMAPSVEHEVASLAHVLVRRV